MLPNFSKLAIATDTKLFEFLARSKGGKNKKCEEHLSENKESSGDINCAIDGYLMFKELKQQQTKDSKLDGDIKTQKNYIGKYIKIEVGDQKVEFQPLGPSGSSDNNKSDRFTNFQNQNLEWTKKTFPIVCRRSPKGRPAVSIEWNEYGEELTSFTDWYFLDKDGHRGHLFVQLFYDDKRKDEYEMPSNGYMKSRYLYVALVCAGGENAAGYGKFLMRVVEELGKKLECNGILLSTLSNSAGFYYSLGYRFVNKAGGVIDASDWVSVEEKDGKKRFLLDLVGDGVEKIAPKKRDRDDEERDASFISRLLKSANKMLKSMSSPLSLNEV